MFKAGPPLAFEAPRVLAPPIGAPDGAAAGTDGSAAALLSSSDDDFTEDTAEDIAKASLLALRSYMFQLLPHQIKSKRDPALNEATIMTWIRQVDSIETLRSLQNDWLKFHDELAEATRAQSVPWAKSVVAEHRA